MNVKLTWMIVTVMQLVKTQQEVLHVAVTKALMGMELTAQVYTP